MHTHTCQYLSLAYLCLYEALRLILSGRAPCAIASAAFSNERVVLRSRPKNTFRANNLELVSEEQDPSSLADGEVIVYQKVRLQNVSRE